MGYQQSLLLPVVTLKISFEDLFGKKATESDEKERRGRWAEWLRLVRKSNAPHMANYWAGSGSVSECSGCIHRRGRWCTSAGLPCAVNPILSFRDGQIGMACMGAGKQEKTA